MASLKGKIVLVTGAGGFIGSHVVEDLLRHKAKVIALDIKSKDESVLPKHNYDNPNLVYICGDITDLETVTRIFVKYSIDYICHQAALAGMPMSFVRPDEYVKTNIMGTNLLFDYARRCGIKRVVYASSSSVYGQASPYAYTKIIDEKLAEMYNKLYNMEFIGLRYFNVYGPRQKAGDNCAVIPAIIKSVLNNEPFTLYGDGDQRRDFTFVRDVSDANIKALEYEGPDRIFDIGTSISTSIKELCSGVSEKLNKSVIINYQPEREGDVRFSKAQITKTIYELGWDVNYFIDKGLYITCEAYRQ